MFYPGSCPESLSIVFLPMQIARYAGEQRQLSGEVDKLKPQLSGCWTACKDKMKEAPEAERTVGELDARLWRSQSKSGW